MLKREFKVFVLSMFIFLLYIFAKNYFTKGGLFEHNDIYAIPIAILVMIFISIVRIYLENKKRDK